MTKSIRLASRRSRFSARGRSVVATANLRSDTVDKFSKFIGAHVLDFIELARRPHFFAVNEEAEQLGLCHGRSHRRRSLTRSPSKLAILIQVRNERGDRHFCPLGTALL